MISTAFSDLFLAGVCLFCLARLGGPISDAIPARLVGWGLLLMAIAAGCGAARFAGFGGEDLVEVHLFLSRVAGQVGIPLLGLGFIATRWAPLRNENVARFLPLGLMILFGVFEFYVDFPAWREAAATIGVGMVLFVGIGELNRHPPAGFLAIAGAVGIVLAGMVIGTRGEWFGLPALDWFHYALAACYFMIAEAMRRL